MSHHCAGCSTTAGMAGCPEHGGHSWSSSQPVVTHCQHGLDLRLNPRCYLCTPLAPTPPDELREAAQSLLAQADHFTSGPLWDYELANFRRVLEAGDE